MRFGWFLIVATAIAVVSGYLSLTYRVPMYAVLGLAASFVVVILGLGSLMVKRKGPPAPPSPPT